MQAGSASIDSNDRPRTGSPGMIPGTPVAPPKKERKKRVGPSPQLRAMVARGGPAKYIKEIKKSRETRLQQDVDRLVLVPENDSGHRSEFSAPSSPAAKPSGTKASASPRHAGVPAGGGVVSVTAEQEDVKEQKEKDAAPIVVAALPDANGADNSRKVSIDNNSDDNYIYTDYDEDFESYTSNRINEEALKEEHKKGQRSGASSSIQTNDAITGAPFQSGNRKQGDLGETREASGGSAGAAADMSDLEDSLC